MKASINIYADVEVIQKFKDRYGDQVSHQVEEYMKHDLDMKEDQTVKDDAALERYAESYRRAKVTEQTECKMQFEFYKTMGKIPKEMLLSEYFVKYFLQGVKP